MNQGSNFESPELVDSYRPKAGRKKRLGPKSNAWKGESASVQSKHQWLRATYGRPSFCMNSDCQGISKAYEWCLKTGHQYTHNPTDYV